MTTLQIQSVLVALQVIVVAFLLLHDYVPLGRLSNLQAVRGSDSPMRLLVTTLLSALPWALGLGFSLRYWAAWPGWVHAYLWWSYWVLIVGAALAWWIPYLLVPSPERAARYKVRFAGTVRFLPERNGISPDALHVGFHLVVVAIVVLLAIM